MNARILTIACVLVAFACGAVTTALVDPTAAHASEGQFRECFGQGGIEMADADDVGPTFTPKKVTTIPNGWTVVGVGADQYSVIVVVCR